jgi:Flp pilus assembly protein protease CpaA
MMLPQEVPVVLATVLGRVASLPAEWWITGLIGGAAAVEDLWRRTISNWLCLAALVSGMAFHGWIGGWRGVGESLLGAVCGFGIFLLFYLLGGMGGGDVKLMGGLGAVLGWSRALYAAFWTALTGGLLAAAVIGYAGWRRGANEVAATPQSIPYAPAIAAGAWLALLSSPQ